ncbi:hypothetical protein EXN66_Car011884 [Channa argus]|uniref:Uncharacterized protein n=1 Tax=Channa argus TaxID=215402 RepID=A0A6G1Q1S7_CHAAH|nr:hypothetical protein EXN66_Car011884 [Channa argus]
MSQGPHGEPVNQCGTGRQLHQGLLQQLFPWMSLPTNKQHSGISGMAKWIADIVLCWLSLLFLTIAVPETRDTGGDGGGNPLCPRRACADDMLIPFFECLSNGCTSVRLQGNSSEFYWPAKKNLYINIGLRELAVVHGDATAEALVGSAVDAAVEVAVGPVACPLDESRNTAAMQSVLNHYGDNGDVERDVQSVSVVQQETPVITDAQDCSQPGVTDEALQLLTTTSVAVAASTNSQLTGEEDIDYDTDSDTMSLGECSTKNVLSSFYRRVLGTQWALLTVSHINKIAYSLCASALSIGHVQSEKASGFAGITLTHP